MRNFYLGLIAFFAKAGPKIFSVLAKILKTVKLGKAGLAGASLVTYAHMFTWEFALMICAMLFVHESGHIWAMRQYGLKTKGIYFIPFVGAAAVSSDEFPSRGAEVYIALMGPLWGFAISVVTALVYYFSGNLLFAAGAGWMATCNLLNLLPINPLDGGRVLKSIAFSLHSSVGIIFLIIGMIIGLSLGMYAGFGLFVFLLFIGGLELLMEWGREYSHKKNLKKFLSDVQETLCASDADMNDIVDYVKAHDADDEYVKKLTQEKKIQKFAYTSVARASLGYAREAILEYRKGKKPSMTLLEIGYSTLAYGAVAGILWLLIRWTEHVPEVSAAMEILKG